MTYALEGKVIQILQAFQTLYWNVKEALGRHGPFNRSPSALRDSICLHRERILSLEVL